MAKRKGWQRALSGLGQGIANVSEFALKQGVQDRANQNILNRQIEMDNRNFKEELLKGLAKGDYTLDQIKAIAKGRGIPLDDAGLATTRPKLRSRLGALDEAIDKADKPEMVPSDERILSEGRKHDDAFLPDEFMVADAMTNVDDPFAAASGELKESRSNAETKRKALRDAPTERYEVTNPDETKSVFYGPKFTEPVTLSSITAAQRGANTGTAKKAEIGVSGQAQADQAALERTATTQAGLNVENDPKNVAGSARRESTIAGARTAASTAAEINTKLANAEKLIAFKTQEALAQIQVETQGVEAREWAQNVAAAQKSANDALPIVGQLRLLWQDAHPEIEKWARMSPVGTKEMAAQIAQGLIPRSVMPEAVRKYYDALEAARPRLARAMGNVGNFTEGEQERAGYVAADFIDAINGGATGYEKFDRLENLFLAAPVIAKASRPGARPMTADQITAIVDQQKRASPGDVNLPANAYDILITPSGVQRRPQ